MEILIILILLFVLLTVITIVGHLIWVVLAAILRWLLADNRTEPPPSIRSDPLTDKHNDLVATERQITRFYTEGKLTDETYRALMRQIRAERDGFAPPAPPPAPASVRQPAPEPKPAPTPAPAVVTASLFATDDKIVIEPTSAPLAVEVVAPPTRLPRRPFSEVLNSFMEESNIRWGEIIGGLLIIGCSTALVISLWAQISQIPVLKFLIFTTVTAVLFGIGLYTEHRWKLPTTSRGILTIATLLVPLNFLAIAAVSASNTSGALVIGSELVAPAIFLCLVYFAGRIITPGCAHILSAGVLGSSIGQLLVRHLATTDISPALLIFLGAFPVVCYVVTVALALRIVLQDREIDESETTTVFTVLGTMSFAALLPFGLLLYRSGPMGLSMMYLAPLVTLWGLPMLATGTILWRRINNKELVASRITGTALGILGVMIALAGMILAWPNPASIVPAALLNFAILTVLAIALELPVAHLIAAICFALAYVVAFHVLAGNIPWINLRVMSLLDVSISYASGEALVVAFALFLAASEWLSRRKRERDSYYYLVAACLTAAVSLTLARAFAIEIHNALWLLYGVYSLGAFWIAWRRRLVPFTWIGSALLLFSLARIFSIGFSFPWQTALFTHATLCAVAAIVSSRYKDGEVFSVPLNYSALISVVLGVVALFEANTWEVTWMQAQRVYWIAGILFLLLWLNRRRIILNSFQIALIGALVLTVKAALQQFEWYSYSPHAFLHPSALQIYGTVLTLFCLAWLALRLIVKRDEWRRLDSSYSIDRLLSWLLLGAFVLFAVYGSFSGIARELGALGTEYRGFNIAGFPHQEALALGSWIVLGLLTVLMLANYRERRQKEYLLSAVTVLSAAIPLLAGRFESQMATTAAWRWFAAVFLLGGSIVLWYRKNHSKQLRLLLILLTVAPLLLLTVFPAVRAITALPIPRPMAGIFSWFGDSVLYGAPLVLVALVMIGYAVRERLPQFAIYGGLFINATVTISFLLAVAVGQGFMDRVALVRLGQLNAIAFAVYAYPWLSTRRLWQQRLSEGGKKLADELFELQVGLAIVLNVLLIVPVVFRLIIEPEPVDTAIVAAGSVLGWLALVTTLVAAAWLARIRERLYSASLLASGLLAASCLTAFSVARTSGWLGFNVLTICTTLSAWLMLPAADRDQRWQRPRRQFAAVIGAFAAFLSWLAAINSSQDGWWSVGPLLALSALAAALNWQTLRRRYIYAAGILFNLAASVWCIRILPIFDDGFFAINIIAGCLGGIAWLWLELRSRRLRTSETSRSTALSFHNLGAIGWPVLLAFFVVVSFGIPRNMSPLTTMPMLHWLALAATLALMIAVLWDKHAKYAVAGLYLLGLLAGAMALYQLDLPNTRLAWSFTILFAIYALSASIIWHRREQMIALAQRFGVARRLESGTTELLWLSTFTILLTAVVVSLAYWIDLSFVEFELRVSAALAVGAQFLTFGLLAEGAWVQRWRRVALAVLIVGIVLFGWSWLTPGVNGTWLNRSVILMLEAFGLTALYGLMLDKVNARFPNWTNAARSCIPWLLGAGVLALFFCLGTEVSYQVNYGAVRIHPFSLVAIGVTLVAAIVIGVLFALSPSHDPLSLPERGRMRYVYAAEIMLALLFLHIRLTLPWLFTGFIERYWPLAVMMIAYFGVVTSEALRRRKLLVLAQPLERTGVFLPLLPVLGFWLASSEVDFSVLLFVIGGLYGLLSILRRSFVFGVLAAVAGNGGLWYVLHRTPDYQFLQHPQLWLIPVALSVLIAAYLNEDKMTEDQMAGVRYLSLVTIYASSTADIFINGVANSPWLPLILGSFSLAGIFAGIVFRIRGLLLLGSIFLLLSIITMIWYASANLGWTWLWYVAGIVTGATIIFMFALFEKKRTEVLRVVEGLKDWER
jgi:hypothetical protein